MLFLVRIVVYWGGVIATLKIIRGSYKWMLSKSNIPYKVMCMAEKRDKLIEVLVK